MTLLKFDELLSKILMTIKPDEDGKIKYSDLHEMITQHRINLRLEPPGDDNKDNNKEVKSAEKAAGNYSREKYGEWLPDAYRDFLAGHR